MTTDWKALAKQHYDDAWRMREALALTREALTLIRDIASGSTTANSLPHIARIARAALEPTGEDQNE